MDPLDRIAINSKNLAIRLDLEPQLKIKVGGHHLGDRGIDGCSIMVECPSERPTTRDAVGRPIGD